MRKLFLVLFLAGCTTAGMQQQTARLDHDTAVAQVREAETQFAKAFADRDRARFLSFVADDTTFIGGRRTLHGKTEMSEVWGKFFDEPQAQFSWNPERVEVNGDGTIGLSSGPVRDKDGKEISTYSSIWQRQSDGTWKIIFDGPGCPRG